MYLLIADYWINGEKLLQLTEKDLRRKLGMKYPDDRDLLLNEIQKLKRKGIPSMSM